MPTKMGAGVMGMPLGAAIPAVARASAIGTALQTNTTANSIDFDVPTGGSFNINTANAAGNNFQIAEGVVYMGAHALSWEGSIIAVAPASTKKSIHTNGNALDMAIQARSGGYVDSIINGIAEMRVTTGQWSYVGLTSLINNTADGADTGSFFINGGGSAGTVARGGRMGSFGNEHATFPGNSHVKTGDATGAKLELHGPNGEMARIDLNRLFLSGGFGRVPAVKTTTYTATLLDLIIIGNHATVAFTITLPAATGSGQIYMFGNIGAAVVTIDGNASETINGATTFTLAQNTFQTIVDAAAGVWYKI